jgi:hypothetical protein
MMKGMKWFDIPARQRSATLENQFCAKTIFQVHSFTIGNMFYATKRGKG